MSHALSIRVTLQSVSRHIKLSESAADNKIAGSKVIKTVEQFHSLKARPELGADNFVVKQKIGLAKEGLKPVSAQAIFLEALNLDLMCLCRAE